MIERAQLKLTILAGLAGTLCSTVVPYLSGAQSSNVRPVFEAASVKRSKGERVSMRIGPSGVRYQSATLKAMLEYAYGVPAFAIVGPSWLETERYSVVAKAPFGALPTEFPKMLQNLIVERFHLGFHRETRRVRGYTLLVARAGPKLKEAQGGTAMSTMRFDSLTAKNESVAAFALLLSQVLQQPVDDKTKIQGTYDMELHWESAQPAAAISPASDEAQPEAAYAPEKISGVLSAIQEQLGLRLVAGRIAVQSIIVDHADKNPVAD